MVLEGDVALALRAIGSSTAYRKVDDPAQAFQPYVSLKRLDIAVEPHQEGNLLGSRIPVVVRVESRDYSGSLGRRFQLDRSGASAFVIDLSFAVDSVSSAMAHIVAVASAAEQPGVEIKLSHFDSYESAVSLLPNLFGFEVRELIRECRTLGTTLRWLDDPNSEISPVTRQLPFVFTILSFCGQGDYIDFLPHRGTFERSGSTPLRVRQRRWGALLFRWRTPTEGGSEGDWPDVDLTYLNGAQKPGGSVLGNAHIHRDIYVSCNIRSCVAACNVSSESNDGKDLAKYTIPGLETTLAVGRAQWYAYLVMNALLDSDVDGLRASPLDVSGQMLDKAIERKASLLRILDSTTSYRLASDTLWKLHDHFSNMFGVTELRRHALAKLELLDSLVASLRQSFVVKRLAGDRSPDGGQPALGQDLR